VVALRARERGNEFVRIRFAMSGEMESMREAAAAVVNKSRKETSARDVLLRAASELMVEHETYDVSLHAIAKRAGVTAPLVKYHFGSREGLLFALVQRDTARSLTQLQELAVMPLPPVTKLKFHIKGIIRTYARYPYLNGLLNHLLRDTQSEASEQTKDNFIQPLINAQRAIIEEGIADGSFKSIDPNEAYFLIVGACQYLFASRVAFRKMMNDAFCKDDFVRDYAATVVEVVISGLLKRQPTSDER
jgi:TetR/AcrR family transcriptional regulator